jgi:NAD+ synthase
MTLKGAYQKIFNELQENVDIAVVGMSGGADSTLVTLLCSDALGPKNVYTLHMPYSGKDLTYFNSRSMRVAKKIEVRRQKIDIGDPVDALVKAMQPALSKTISPLNLGNAKSRIRANILYAVSSHLGEMNPTKRVRVIGTGNLSEDFIGYDTKGGDALADIFPIGELFKSEVYNLLESFVMDGLIDNRDIDRIPSAGLEENQTDEKDLGYTYDEMEPAIRFCLANYDIMDKVEKTEIVDFVWNRHVVNKHKHVAPPAIRLRTILG